MKPMKPILFSTLDVQATLAGRKTMKRMVVKQSVVDRFVIGEHGELLGSFNGESDAYPTIDDAPYQPGDILYVRETWCRDSDMADCFEDPLVLGVYFKADAMDTDWVNDHDIVRWRPSIHMPRAAARIFLRVTDVRVERLQEITEDDAKAEGMPDGSDYPTDPVYCPNCHGEGLVGTLHPVSLGYMEIDCPDCETAKMRFQNLWDHLNAKRGYAWDTNPWVWVVSFERCEKPQEENA